MQQDYFTAEEIEQIRAHKRAAIEEARRVVREHLQRQDGQVIRGGIHEAQ